MLDIDKISHTIPYAFNEKDKEKWLQERLGRITASRFGELIGENSHEGKFTQGAMSYLIDLAGERVTKKRSREEITTDAITHGNSTEQEALEHIGELKGFVFLREQETNVISQRFIVPDEYTGCTPDALIVPPKHVFHSNGEQINITPLETKCPPTYNIYGRYLAAQEPADIKRLNKIYYWQCIFQIWATASLTGYFGIYNPAFTNNCNVIEFKKAKIMQETKTKNAPNDFTLLEQTLTHAKIEIDKWVDIFSNKN